MPVEQAVCVMIAEAAKQRIEAATVLTDRNFTVRRSYLEWDLELKGLEKAELSEEEKLHIDVVAHTTEQEVELASRGTLRYTVPIDIAVRRKFGENEKDLDTGRIKIEEIDYLVLLVQELHVLFTPVRMTDFPYQVWDNDKGGTKILVNPDRDHLREMRQFTGIIRVYLRADVPLETLNDG